MVYSNAVGCMSLAHLQNWVFVLALVPLWSCRASPPLLYINGARRQLPPYRGLKCFIPACLLLLMGCFPGKAAMFR